MGPNPFLTLDVFSVELDNGENLLDPWRVTITAADGSTVDTEHTSENKTYQHVRTEFLAVRGAEARIEYWESGSWRLFDTPTADEFQAATNALEETP